MQKLWRLRLLAVCSSLVLGRVWKPAFWRHPTVHTLWLAEAHPAGGFLVVAVRVFLLMRLPPMKLVALGHKSPRYVGVAPV